MTATTTLRAALRDREVERLEQAVEANRASLRHLLDLPLDQVTAGDLNDLRDAVGDLLLRGGFNSGWEPNTFGRECEELIDRLAPWLWDKDDCD
jgi:hypothetical protein